MNKIIPLTLFFITALFTNSISQSTLVLQPDSVTGNDTFIFDYYPNNTYGTEDRLDITAWTQFGTPYISRALIQFDLSSIPSTAIINSAYLSLYHNPTSAIYNGVHSGANAFEIQWIMSPWQQNTVTWNTQPSVTNLNEVLLPATVSGTQDFTNIDVTAMVSDMINAPWLSFGFMVRLQVEVQYADLVIAASNHADSSVHPRLVINYLATGIEETHAAAGGITISPDPFSDKINVTTGNSDLSEIIIYDVLSRKILQQAFTRSTSIQTENLAKGMYVYEIKNKNGIIKEGKVVKE